MPGMILQGVQGVNVIGWLDSSSEVAYAAPVVPAVVPAVALPASVW